MDITLDDVKFKCPHCGHVNTWDSHRVRQRKTMKFARCDDESGGCGTKIVVRTELIIKSKITALKFNA